MRHQFGILRHRTSVRDIRKPKRRVSESGPAVLLNSPFPAHVQHYLFSGRQISLCDRIGTSIPKITDHCEATRLEFSHAEAKLKGRNVSITSGLKETTKITLETVLKEMGFMKEKGTDLIIEKKSVKDPSLVFQAPPSPSQKLQALLKVTSVDLKRSFRHLKRPVGHFVEPFMIPRRRRLPQFSRTESSSPATVSSTRKTSPASPSSVVHQRSCSILTNSTEVSLPRVNFSISGKASVLSVYHKCMRSSGLSASVIP